MLNRPQLTLLRNRQLTCLELTAALQGCMEQIQTLILHCDSSKLFPFQRVTCFLERQPTTITTCAISYELKLKAIKMYLRH